MFMVTIPVEWSDHVCTLACSFWRTSVFAQVGISCEVTFPLCLVLRFGISVGLLNELSIDFSLMIGNYGCFSTYIDCAVENTTHFIVSVCDLQAN